MGQQDNQCGLAHIGGFATHVGAGNHQHAPLFVQVQVIGDKGCFQHLFNHRVATTTDLDARLLREGGWNQTETVGAFCETDQRVQFGHCCSALLQRQ